MTLFKDEEDAFVGKYLLKRNPNLKKISLFDNMPKWVATSIMGCVIYSFFFVLFYKLLFGAPLVIRLLLCLPPAAILLPLVSFQFIAFSMFSRRFVLWVFERLPAKITSLASDAFLSLLLLLSNLARALKYFLRSL